GRLAVPCALGLSGDRDRAGRRRRDRQRLRPVAPRRGYRFSLLSRGRMVLAGVQSCRQRDLPGGGGDVAGRALVAPRRATSKGEGRPFAMTVETGAFVRRGAILLAVA